jgi:AcrR family transcriptional regulator
MQVLKDEVRDKIRKSSIKEFKQKGYEKASMREIAKGANMSVGNLYRYFNNKHSLFYYIVGEIYESIKTNHKFEYRMQFIDVNFLEYVELIKSIVKARSGNIDELYILLEKSKGSEYEDVKEVLIKKFENFINDKVLPLINVDKEIVVGTVFPKALAVSIVEGICTILVEVRDEEEFISNMVQYLELTIKSTIRTLVYIRDDKFQFRRLSDEEVRESVSSNNNC